VILGTEGQITSSATSMTHLQMVRRGTFWIGKKLILNKRGCVYCFVANKGQSNPSYLTSFDRRKPAETAQSGLIAPVRMEHPEAKAPKRRNHGGGSSWMLQLCFSSTITFPFKAISLFTSRHQPNMPILINTYTSTDHSHNSQGTLSAVTTQT